MHILAWQTNSKEDMGCSVKEKQVWFQCRMKDIDVKANMTWKYETYYMQIMQQTKPNRKSRTYFIL